MNATVTYGLSQMPLPALIRAKAACQDTPDKIELGSGLIYYRRRY